MTRARDIANLVDANGDVNTSALGNVQTPTLSSLGLDNHDQVSVDASGNVTATAYNGSGASLTGIEAFPTNWTASLSGSDMIFSYSGTAKFKITTGGAVVAIDDITAYGSL
jgi:hypothetical protein